MAQPPNGGGGLSSSSPAAAVPSLSPAECAKKINNFDVWIQDCCIRLYAQPNQHVAEFFCGNGVALSRLMVDMVSPVSNTRVGENVHSLASYLAVDVDTGSAKNRWITKDMPFRADFRDLDLTQVSLLSPSSSSSSLAASSLDVIYCFKGLSRVCSTLSGLQCVLRNVSSMLKPGGLFVGSILDPAVAWYKISKKDRESGGKPVKPEKGEGVTYFGPGYKLDFPHLARSNATFECFTPRVKCYFQLTDSAHHPSKAHPASSAYLLHAHTLAQEAARVGLEMVHMQNYLDFYEEHSSIGVFAESLKRLNLLPKHSPGQLTPQQADIFSLHTTFAFRKAPTNDSAAAPMEL